MIKLIITDFDGTLVDTFYANYYAYAKVLSFFKITLTEQKYRSCYGFRYDKFIRELSITNEDIIKEISIRKSEIYPDFFHKLKLNTTLLNFIRAFKKSGGKVAVASTAKRINLLKVIDYLNLKDDFDFIVAGEDVINSKPDPEIYNLIMSKFNVSPEQTLVFEDSPMGIDSANASWANLIQVTEHFF